MTSDAPVPEPTGRPAAEAINPKNDTPFGAKFPVIDKDPHFNRVIKFFRPSDYAVWGSVTAAVPGLISFMEYIDPTHGGTGRRSIVRIGWYGGAAMGFLCAYQRSSYRFFGWTENVREVAMAKKEWADAKLPGGKKPWGYGESMLPPWLQGVAFRNSVYMASSLSLFPMFNFTNHPYHFADEGLEG